MLINGIKFACNTCVKGHRSSACNHIERPLIEIRKKGRPVTQCSYCRDLRKTKQVHIKCTCSENKKNIGNTATTTSLTQNSSTPKDPTTAASVMMMDDYYFFNNSSSSLRFLEGQIKSPKRKPSKKNSVMTRKSSKDTTSLLTDTIPPFTVLPDQQFTSNTQQQLNTEMASDPNSHMEDLINSSELNALLNNVLDAKNEVIPTTAAILQDSCGSITPHSTCNNVTQQQGQSVVITITPLSTTSTSESREPMSRIVTCYCGDSCICPGCFVHPNNYDALFNQAVSQPCFMPYSMSSSSCSSDDEDQQIYNPL